MDIRGSAVKWFSSACIVAGLAVSSTGSKAQVFPPGTFSVDGIPIVCGGNTFVFDPSLPDVGMNNGMGVIRLNPMVLGQLPTVLKLYWVGHECGHSVVGANEVAADCWSVRTGKNQGWFPPQAFNLLMQMFANSPGDMAHPSGPNRVAMMWQCYNSA